MSWNYFNLREYPVRDTQPSHFASWKESQPIDKMDKMLMLQRCKLEIECLKYNIESVKELPPITKSDGSVHKTKMSIRTSLIKKWENEVKIFQSWFDEYKMKDKKLIYTCESFRKTWMHSSQFVVNNQIEVLSRKT